MSSKPGPEVLSAADDVQVFEAIGMESGRLLAGGPAGTLADDPRRPWRARVSVEECQRIAAEQTSDRAEGGSLTMPFKALENDIEIDGGDTAIA
jgi:hypothetical protein